MLSALLSLYVTLPQGPSLMEYLLFRILLVAMAGGRGNDELYSAFKYVHAEMTIGHFKVVLVVTIGQIKPCSHTSLQEGREAQFYHELGGGDTEMDWQTVSIIPIAHQLYSILQPKPSF